MFKQKLCHLFRLVFLLANRDLHPRKTKMSGESPFLIGDTSTQLVVFSIFMSVFRGVSFGGPQKIEEGSKFDANNVVGHVEGFT